MNKNVVFQQFVLQESISSFFMDNIPWLQKHRHSRKMLQAALGIPMCLVGLLMVTEVNVKVIVFALSRITTIVKCYFFFIIKISAKYNVAYKK